MLSFLAKAWDVKLLLFLLCSFVLALAMHLMELTRAEPLAFFRSHENACEKKKNTFLPTCTDLHHLPPPAKSARGIHFHSRKNSGGALLGEENEGWGKGDTHMGQLSWWSDRGLGSGCVGCWWGAGSQGVSVIWLWSMWPRLSFPAGLSTLRVRYKGGMPLIPDMPTCLKTSHLLPKTDTQPNNQSDPLEPTYSHRRASHSCAPHLNTLPPYSCHLICFPLL